MESAARITGRLLQAVTSSQSSLFACRKCTSHISDKASPTSLKGSMLIPVLCRCGHEFGFQCISSWLSPNEGKNSCPNCRRVLFPTAPNINNGFAQLHHDNDTLRAITASLASDLSILSASLNTFAEPNRAPLPNLPRLPPVLTAPRPGLLGSNPVAPTRRR